MKTGDARKTSANGWMALVTGAGVALWLLGSGTAAGNDRAVRNVGAASLATGGPCPARDVGNLRVALELPLQACPEGEIICDFRTSRGGQPVRGVRGEVDLSIFEIGRGGELVEVGSARRRGKTRGDGRGLFDFSYAEILNGEPLCPEDQEALRQAFAEIVLKSGTEVDQVSFLCFNDTVILDPR